MGPRRSWSPADSSTAYALAQKGEFPVRVVRIGSRYVVPTADLRALLGMGAAA